MLLGAALAAVGCVDAGDDAPIDSDAAAEEHLEPKSARVDARDYERDGRELDPSIDELRAVATATGTGTERTRATEPLSGGRESADTDEAIADSPSAKCYVALSSVASPPDRAQSDVEAIVVEAFKRQLRSAGSFLLAPATESSDAAKARMSKAKMKGLHLAIAVDRFDYSDGNLSVKVRVSVATYPGKALLGSVERSVTKTGVPSSDRSSEDQLIELAATRASAQLAQNAGAFL